MSTDWWWRNYSTETATHIVYHGGNSLTELMELELGFKAAFDLFHRDDIMFGELA